VGTVGSASQPCLSDASRQIFSRNEIGAIPALTVRVTVSGVGRPSIGFAAKRPCFFDLMSMNSPDDDECPRSFISTFTPISVREKC